MPQLVSRAGAVPAGATRCPLTHLYPASRQRRSARCAGHLKANLYNEGYTCTVCCRRFSAADVAWLAAHTAPKAVAA